MCAFANDIVNSRSPGYLLIGVDDKSGKASGLQVTDQLLPNLAALGTDGNILPAPTVLTYKIALSDGSGEVAVVEVRPSDLPPVRYKGLVRIRRGPRKGIANEQEERLLAERRVANALTFDALPCTGSTLAELALDLFTVTYCLPSPIDRSLSTPRSSPRTNAVSNSNWPVYASLTFVRRHQPTPE